ncbi:hypothetical protein JD969_00460 [Planctomycetota bacterium]|nr:hypothetical protein JD969_00460 [Planctomycetota bacterium]
MNESENSNIKQQIEEIEKECENKTKTLKKRLAITNWALFLLYILALFTSSNPQLASVGFLVCAIGLGIGYVQTKNSYQLTMQSKLQKIQLQNQSND